MATAVINPSFDCAVRRSATTSWNDSVTGNGTAVVVNGAIIYENAVYAGNYVGERIYTLWYTTSIPTNATITSATIDYYFTAGRRGTQIGSAFKLFKSDTLTETGNANLFESITSSGASTSTDIGGEGVAAD